MGYLNNETYLVVDLATGEAEEESIDEEFFQEHVGGAAANLALYEEHKDGDPIVLGTGLLTGTLVPGGGSGVITAKSPRTGQVCHAPLTLWTGMELKYSGFDFVVIKNVSENPVFLWLHDSIADVRNADKIWGKDTWATTSELRTELGEDIIQVLTIGQAGEKGSDLAQVMANYWATGDCWGFGGLLGQKKVKAIAMRGMGMFDMEEMDDFMAGAAALTAEAKAALSGITPGIGGLSAAMGEDLTDWLAPLAHRNKACFNCPVPMNTFIKFNEDPGVMDETDVADPGVLITSVADILGFKNMGLSLEDAGKALAACNKQGIDPQAVADLCTKAGNTDLGAIQGALSGLAGPTDATPKGPMSNWAPEALAGSGDWKQLQALANVLGLHTRYILMAPFLTPEKLLEMVNLGTGFDISSQALDAAMAKLG